jgi:hypothetical protein
MYHLTDFGYVEKTITSWTMEHARMAQNRRELTERAAMSLARRVFRPTALHHSNPSLAVSERIT